MAENVVEFGAGPQTGLEEYAIGVLEQSRPMHKVAVEFERGPRTIGAGPITGAIRDVWVEYDGVRITEVPEGEDFSPKVSYSADNPGDRHWGICVTMISTDGQIRNYAITGTPLFGAEHLEEGDLDVNDLGATGPMPAHDITLRFKLFGNPEKEGDPPAQSLW